MKISVKNIGLIADKYKQAELMKAMLNDLSHDIEQRRDRCWINQPESGLSIDTYNRYKELVEKLQRQVKEELDYTDLFLIEYSKTLLED